MNSPVPGFSGNSPGYCISAVVDAFTTSNLHTVLGSDVVALIEALVATNDRISALRRVAVQTLRDRPTDLVDRHELREICINATSADKLKELIQRLDIASIDALRCLQLEHDPAARKIFLGFYGLDTSLTSAVAPPPDQDQISPAFGLFPHQRHVADQTHAAIRGGHGRLVLHMPTGTGKTRTAMHVVSRVLTESEPCVVVWLASASELLDQAADAFHRAWSRLGNRNLQMVRFWGQQSPRLSDLSDGLLIAGLQKMHSFSTRDPIAILRLAARTNLVVVDEAHQAIATTYRSVITTLVDTGPNAALLGLTATPGRTWSDIDTDKRLSTFFGERKVTIEIKDCTDPVSRLIEWGYLAQPTFRRLDVEAPPELKSLLRHANTYGMDYDAELLEALAVHTTRNVTIVHEVQRLLHDGHTRIMFFGASVRHAKLMAAALSALGIDARLITADTDTAQRRRVIRAFRTPSATPLVLCNFGVLTAGFDAPNTSACVIARPTKSLVLFSQMVGRATRGPRAGGNTTCEISTVVDLDLPGFRDLAEAFTNWEDVWHDAR